MDEFLFGQDQAYWLSMSSAQCNHLLSVTIFLNGIKELGTAFVLDFNEKINPSNIKTTRLYFIM